jgi:hypothetical protein
VPPSSFFFVPAALQLAGGGLPTAGLQATAGEIADDERDPVGFTLSALGQAHRRLSELMDDPEPIMQQLVRVYIADNTFYPGFQFLPGGQLPPPPVPGSTRNKVPKVRLFVHFHARTN